MSTTILVVDDNSDIRESLSAHLQRNEFETVLAEDAAKAREQLSSHTINLVVLDIMMPGEDGLSLCRHLTEVSKIPVILLTALSDETDRIVGLEIGADDYVTKPFNPRELVARIRAVLRRTNTPNQIENEMLQVVRFGNWELDIGQQELKAEDGLIVPLSSGELALLKTFIENPHTVLSRDDLMERTRGRENLPFERSIDNLISRIRKKIEADPKNPRILKTVWGGGYSFVLDPEKA